MSSPPFDPNKLMGKFFAHVELQSMFTVIRLGVVDALASAEGPLTAAELAEHPKVAADAAMLHRIMRFLSSNDGIGHETPLFTESEEYGFSLTPYGRMCTTEALPASADGDDDASFSQAGIGGLAMHLLEPGVWKAMGALAESTSAGKSPFAIANPEYEHIFAYYAANPETAGAYFNSAMAHLSNNRVVASGRYDFGKYTTGLTDVGGSHGLTMHAIKENFPAVGPLVCFDLPTVLPAEDARPADVQYVGGDFFKADDIPASDNFFLKHIIHDWGDEPSVQILKNCASKLKDPKAGRIVLVDAILPSLGDSHGHGAKSLDVWMLTLCPGGKERTIHEWSSVLAQAGLEIVMTQRISEEPGPHSFTFVIEARVAGQA